MQPIALCRPCGYMILASKLNNISCSTELRGCSVCFVILIAFGSKRSTVLIARIG